MGGINRDINVTAHKEFQVVFDIFSIRLSG
jgi:hypothetical protein